jgi:hypothetical protein
MAASMHALHMDLGRTRRQRLPVAYPNSTCYIGVRGGNPARRWAAATERLWEGVRQAWTAAPLASRIGYAAEVGDTTWDSGVHMHMTCGNWLRSVKSDPSAVRDDGGVVAYCESVSWERYGSRSYPRIESRRLTVVAVDGTESTLRDLARGERAEAAIDSAVPGRAARRQAAAQAELQTRHPCHKRVAVRPDGVYVSIYDGRTEYHLGVTTTARVRRPGNDICAAGGIFVHRTRAAAERQDYPTESAALDLPRVTLRGEYWGRTNYDDKIAAEHFRPLAVCA